MSTPQRKREHCWALVILTISTLCCFHKLVQHPQSVLVGPQNGGSNDLTNYYIPSREYATNGEDVLPFWNPHVCLGLPFTGNPQSALYYPPNWLCYLLPARLAVNWLLVAHHLFAGVGMYLLARRYGLCWSASVLGGILFLAAPFLIAQSAEGHYAQVSAVAWAPWAFLAFESVRRGERFGVAALTLCLAMSFFCGHAQETYYLTLILTVFACWDAIQSFRRKRRRDAGRLLLDWGRVGLFTAGLVAIDLVPIFVNSRMSLRPSLDQIEGDYGWGAFRLENLQELLAPFAVTRPELWEAGTAPFWEKVCFFGVVPLVLAAAAPLIARRRPLTWRMTILWAATLLFAFGTNGPFYSTLVNVIPGLSWFRLPSRVLFFTSLATALLAAVSIDELRQRLRGGSGERWRLPCGVAVVALGLIAGWSGVTTFESGLAAVRELITIPALIALAVPIAAAVSMSLTVRPRVQSLIVGGLMLACLVEFTLFAHAVTETATLTPLAERDTDLAALLQRDAPTERGRVLAIQEIVGDDDARQYDLRKVRGYDPAGPAGYLLLLHVAGGEAADSLDPMGFQPVDVGGLRENVLDLIGVDYAIQLRPASGAAVAVPDGWERVHTGVTAGRTLIDGAPESRRFVYDVLRNRDALPRAFVVGRARAVSRFEEFAGLIDDLDFRREVVLQSDVLPDGPRSAYRPASIVHASASRLDVQATLDAPGYLVLPELSFPGWRASVDGHALPVLKANMAFRAVPLPAGEHQVLLEFRPPGLLFGALISAATMLALIFKSAIRQRNPSQHPAAEPAAELKVRRIAVVH